MPTVGTDPTLSVEQIQADLSLDPVEDAVACAAAQSWWDAFGYKSYYPMLQYQYAKRATVQTLIGVLRATIDVTDLEGAVNLHQEIDTLTGLADELTAGIRLTELQAAGAAGGTMAVITKTTPITRDNGYQADPNARVLRGDPLRRFPNGSVFRP